MTNPRIRLAVCVVLVAWVFVSMSVAQSKKRDKVQRAKRPVFTERDWDGVYFKNLFKEGLYGARPENLGKRLSKPETARPDTTGTEVTNEGGIKWSEIVPSAVLENEVKRLQLLLDRQVTTPTEFKGGLNRDIRQSYSMLALLFGIIDQYDSEVRWKRFAATAAPAFARAAAAARSTTDQSYQAAKARRVDLQELVRGGNFPPGPALGEDDDWSSIVDRSPIMIRLESAYQQGMRPFMAGQSEFRSNAESILHEAQMVAALGQVLAGEGMDDADDDGYRQYASEMSDAAKGAAAAVQNNDFASLQKFVNLIDQSCSGCHDEWR